MKAEELYWIAGIFEGEGCLSVGNSKRGVGSINAAVGMTDKDIVDRFENLCPGLRYERRQDSNWKTLYIWQVNGKNAYEFIKMIYPLLGKRRQARARELFEIFESPKAKGNRRELLREQVASLLDKGYNGRMIAKELEVSESYVSQLRKEID